MEQDLALTGAVQHMLLPSDDVVYEPDLRVAGFYRPASRCGGDWWWFERLADGHALVLLGDVTGHGAGAVVGCRRGGVAGGWGQEARRECREGFEKRASIHDRGFFINLELNVPANGQTVACTAPAY